jgi:hypothetical protein
MPDKEIRITVDGNQIQSLRIVDLKATPGPSTAEKVLYFFIGIPLLIYWVIHSW